GLVAAAAIGTMAYQAGVSQGIALQPPAATAPVAPGGAAQATPAPYPYYPYRYYGRGPFGFFGFVGPLFGLIFFIFIMRTIFWGLFGWDWGGRGRWWSTGYDPAYGPSRLDDWHGRAHDRIGDDQQPPPRSA